VVLPFAVAGDVRGDLVATTISEVIVQRLARFPGLRVIGPATARARDPRLIGRGLGGRFVLQGSVGFREPILRLSCRLTDATRGDLVWAGTETVDAWTLRGFEVEEHWAAGVAAEIGDYAGAVYRRASQRPSTSVDPGEYAARLAFQAYVEGGTPATLMAADDALATAMDAGIRSPVILAMRGSTRAAQAAHGMSMDPEAELAAAEQLAREALAEDPGIGHAHVVLGTVALTRHQWDLARKHAGDAALASPFHPTTLATAGSLIAYAGDWEQGVALLRESLRLNPLHPGYMHTLLALDRLMVDDDAAALAESSLIHAPGGIWGPLLRAMALAGLGQQDQARREMDAVLAIEPTFLDNRWRRSPATPRWPTSTSTHCCATSRPSGHLWTVLLDRKEPRTPTSRSGRVDRPRPGRRRAGHGMCGSRSGLVIPAPQYDHRGRGCAGGVRAAGLGSGELVVGSGLVDGKIGPRPKAEVRDAHDAIV
jgi:adenylate cyclase